MAMMRHREVESVMPPEVRSRARKVGVSEGNVDWYAGRRYDVNSDLRSELRFDGDRQAGRTVSRAAGGAARPSSISRSRAAGAMLKRMAVRISRELDRLAHVGRHRPATTK